MGKKKKSKVKKSFQSTESIALNSLLDFLNLDENNATSEVTYFTCLKVLSEGIAKLPLDLQEVSNDGGIRDLKEEPLWRTVRVRPNPYMSPSSFWTIVENCRNHYGNAYVYIDRDTEKGVTLWPLSSDCMRIMMIGPDKTNPGLRESDDVLYIYNDPDNGQEYVFPSEDILHFRSSSIFGGLVGLSVQEKLKTSIYGAKRSQKMLNELYDSNFVPKAVLMFDGTAEMDQKNQETYLKMLQDYVEGKNSGAKSFLPLSRGTTVQPLNIRLTDGQFLELRQYTALQIAAAFGIKPNHLNDYTKSSYANSETQQLAFYTDTMLYNLKQYEEEMIYKLLSYGQQAKGWRFKFNIAAVLRGDTKSQVESLTQGISCGLYTPNEARRNIDLPNKPGGDRLYFNGSNIPVQDAGIQYREQEQSDNTKAILRLTESIEKAVKCDIIYKKPVFGDGHRIVDNTSEGGDSSGGSDGSGQEGSSVLFGEAINSKVESDLYKQDPDLIFNRSR